ncbi:MAG: glutathione S-transferase family protein, partial [Halioglobus sp.]|nr:glutathione S-transferase family protein [Halioglobus sp.]
KVPAITTEDGQHLSESAVICEYLEQAYPDKPLYPADAYERACVRQIMKVSELYLELPSRSLIAYAFSGKPAPEPALANARHQTTRGLGAMARLCSFAPHIAGSEFTIADIYVHYVNAVVLSIGCPQMDWDIIGEVPGMKEWGLNMRDSDIARRVEAERKANEPEFYDYISNYMASDTIPGK